MPFASEGGGMRGGNPGEGGSMVAGRDGRGLLGGGFGGCRLPVRRLSWGWAESLGGRLWAGPGLARG